MSPTPLFHHGEIVGTPAAVRALHEEGIGVWDVLRRHITGDWGDVVPLLSKMNEEAVVQGHRIMSAYTLPRTQVEVWIITEKDRGATTILLPKEY